MRITTRELSSRPSATISRVASMPFITGICTSMSTTSGSRRRVSVDRLGAVAGLADHLDVVLRLEDEAQAGAHQLLVVGQHQLDGHVPSVSP